MGYTTDFYGKLELSRTATEIEKQYINTFSGTRRMRRDVSKLMELYNGKHGYPHNDSIDNLTPEQIYGNEGEYFAMDDEKNGQTHETSIIDYNSAPGQNYNLNWQTNARNIKEGLCQPGLWCQWVLTEDGNFLEWDGCEKFYYYTEWLQYMIKHFFQPWGILLNGKIEWEGEDSDDIGVIILEDNKVIIKEGKI
jgi:hypothetical protein